jgi:hypothetical protein
MEAKFIEWLAWLKRQNNLTPTKLWVDSLVYYSLLGLTRNQAHFYFRAFDYGFADPGPTAPMTSGFIPLSPPVLMAGDIPVYER